jgi:hypothetical protein
MMTTAPWIPSYGRTGDVQLTGSVIENPHGLHWNAFRLWANARLIACKNDAA